MELATTAACPTGRAFLKLFDNDAQAPGFVLHIRHELAMGRLAELLVGLAAYVHPLLDLPHLPDHDPLDPLGLAELAGIASCQVQDLSLLPIHLGADWDCAFQQASPASHAALAATELLVKETVRPVAPLFTGPQATPRDRQGVLTRGGDRRDVDLAQVHPSQHTACLGKGGNLLSGESQAQFVVIRPPGPLGLANIRLLVVLGQRQSQGGSVRSRGETGLAGL